jgi:phosphoribosylglycinamide formyltransferase-1
MECEYMGEKLRIGVLASGSGTDLQSIIDASEKGMIDADVVVVASDNKDAFALKRAEKYGIKAFFVDPIGKKILLSVQVI